MRRRLLGGALLALLLLGVVLGLAGRAALSAADSLERAQGRLTAVSAGRGDTAQAAAALQQAGQDIGRAQDALSAWPVDLTAAVPVIGRSWDAERAVADTASAVVDGASVLLEGLPQVRASAGGLDLPALAQTRDQLAAPAARAEASLAELEATPLALTPPVVRTGVQTAEEGLSEAVGGLQRAHAGLGLLSGVLGGTGARSVLVMLQNNAELRGAGGYASSFATGRLQDGRLELDPLREVEAVADPPERARRVPAPPEYVEDFGALSGNTTIWRSWNLSPHVPDSAAVGASVADALLPGRPDLVVLLDVPALGALAALGGGPIELPDGTAVSPEQLTQALLVDAYAAAGEDVTAQLDRRAALQQAATSAVVRLLTGAVDLDQAARTVSRLASQRHLSVWSARADEQAALVRLGAAGAVQPLPDGDLLHVSVNNVGSNKLDQYVRRDVDVDVVLSPGEATVRQRVRFRNEAPEDLVPYVAGFDRPGVLLSLVELSLPPEAAVLSAQVDGRPWVGTLRAGGVRQRLTTRLELDRGREAVLDLRYRLPVEGDYRLRLVPQPLIRDASLTVSVEPADGYELEQVEGSADARVLPFAATRELSVRLQPPPRSRWSRLQDWWG